MEIKDKQLKRTSELVNDVTHLMDAIITDDKENITQWMRFLENTVQSLKYDLGMTDELDLL